MKIYQVNNKFETHKVIIANKLPNYFITIENYSVNNHNVNPQSFGFYYDKLIDLNFPTINGYFKGISGINVGFRIL